MRRRGAGGGTGAIPAALRYVWTGAGWDRGRREGYHGALPAGYPGEPSGAGRKKETGGAMQVYYPGEWISRGEAAGSAPWGSTLARSTRS